MSSQNLAPSSLVTLVCLGAFAVLAFAVGHLRAVALSGPSSLVTGLSGRLRCAGVGRGLHLWAVALSGTSLSLGSQLAVAPVVLAGVSQPGFGGGAVTTVPCQILGGYKSLHVNLLSVLPFETFCSRATPKQYIQLVVVHRASYSYL